MFLDVIIKDENGEVQAKFIVQPKVFSTGSKGFFGTGRISISGVSFQAQCQLIELGSKPKSATTKK